MGFEGGLAQIEKESLEVLAVYAVSPRLGGAIFATDDAVWVREERGASSPGSTRTSRRSPRRSETPNLPGGGGVVVIGDSVWATASDEGMLEDLRAGE